MFIHFNIQRLRIEGLSAAALLAFPLLGKDRGSRDINQTSQFDKGRRSLSVLSEGIVEIKISIGIENSTQ